MWQESEKKGALDKKNKAQIASQDRRETGNRMPQGGGTRKLGHLELEVQPEGTV